MPHMTKVCSSRSERHRARRSLEAEDTAHSQTQVFREGGLGSVWKGELILGMQGGGGSRTALSPLCTPQA